MYQQVAVQRIDTLGHSITGEMCQLCISLAGSNHIGNTQTSKRSIMNKNYTTLYISKDVYTSERCRQYRRLILRWLKKPLSQPLAVLHRQILCYQKVRVPLEYNVFIISHTKTNNNIANLFLGLLALLITTCICRLFAWVPHTIEAKDGSDPMLYHLGNANLPWSQQIAGIALAHDIYSKHGSKFMKPTWRVDC